MMGDKGPICCLRTGRGMGFYPAVSPDGRRWTLLDSAFIHTGDEAHLVQDEGYVPHAKHLLRPIRTMSLSLSMIPHQRNAD
jgi:hypothetical protein